MGALPEFFQLPLQVLVQLEHFPRRIQAQLSGYGGHQLTLFPLKQRHADAVFHFQQEPAQGRLGDIQPLRRLGEILLLGDYDEIFHLPAIHSLRFLSRFP